MEKITHFPQGFLWGSAVSAYQVEGGIDNCDWSRAFPAGKAADSYYLYERDFDFNRPFFDQLQMNRSDRGVERR